MQRKFRVLTLYLRRWKKTTKEPKFRKLLNYKIFKNGKERMNAISEIHENKRSVQFEKEYLSVYNKGVCQRKKK